MVRIIDKLKTKVKIQLKSYTIAKSNACAVQTLYAHHHIQYYITGYSSPCHQTVYTFSEDCIARIYMPLALQRIGNLCIITEAVIVGNYKLVKNSLGAFHPQGAHVYIIKRSSEELVLNSSSTKVKTLTKHVAFRI